MRAGTSPERLSTVVVLLLTAALSAAQAPAVPPEVSAPATREMAALLAQRAQQVNLLTLWFNVNEERVDLLERELADPTSGIDPMRVRRAYAEELLYVGRYGQGIDEVASLLDGLDATDPSTQALRRELLMLQATIFMRMGEEQNCAEGLNSDSCLLPIKGQGVHQRREGSLQAIGVLEQVLADDPANLRARWLLNIAHMTVGSYPDALEAPLLIPPSAFAPEYPLPAFRNIARDVGLDVYGLSGGAIVDDLDRDGLLDVMVSSVGFRDQVRVFANDGDGRFSERTAGSGLEGETGGLHMIHADYDNDGLVDVVMLRGGWMDANGNFPFSLLRNTGEFRFVDVTKAAGVLRFAPSQTAVWFDYNSDGWLDLFVGNESVPANVQPCQLYHNNGDGTFTEIARQVGLNLVGYVKGVVAGDYDNDERPDLFLSMAEARNALMRNEGPGGPGKAWRFGNVTDVAGVAEPLNSFPAAFFDYDNDGWLDLFVAAYKADAEDVAADYLGRESDAERARLFRNQRDGTFEDVTKPAGLNAVMPVMGLNYGDLDNDGWLDIYTGTGNPHFSTLVPNRMFRNDGGRRFQDVTAAGTFGHLQKGHAISFADIDNDGDQDVFAKMGGAYHADRAYSVLFENPGNRNAWVSLELEGVTSNRNAIGARLKVTVRTARGTREIHRAVGSGASFGTLPFRQEIGLADAEALHSVEVRWPAGRTQVFTGLELNRRYRLREGTTAAEPITRPRVTLSHSAPPHVH